MNNLQPLHEWPTSPHWVPTPLIRKFICADDICCPTQAETLAELVCTLIADLARLTQYCQQCRLKPSVSKTVASVFHFANRQLNVFTRATLC